MSQLKKVGGDIIIQGNGKINNLSGLEKLTGIEGNLEFFVNNVAKMSTKGLDSVRYIKGDLNIKAFGISSLIGLGKLDLSLIHIFINLPSLSYSRTLPLL